MESKKQKAKSKSGFTLIELLVVMAIIGILATLAIASFSQAQRQSRDAQRKSDLRQIQNGLRLFYNDENVYPVGDDTTSGFRIVGCDAAGTGTFTACEWGSSWTVGAKTYMDVLPDEPEPGPDRDYRYERENLDEYTLKACLENTNDPNCNATPEAWCETLGGCVYQVQQ